MQTEPRVKNVMTPFPHAVGVNDPLARARQLMREHHIRHLPVVAEQRLSGVLTDRDIKLVLSPEFDYPKVSELTVGDVYEDNAYTVDLETPLSQVLDEMVERHIGSALVTRKGRLAGIFTATDACRAFAEDLRTRFGPTDDDAA